MPKTKISEFSATPANNTDIDSINIAEGCAPSGINDAIRELMSQLKDFQTGAVGDSFNGPVGSTTASTGAFTNLTASGTLGVTGVATLGAGAILNTPASVTLTNATGLPLTTGTTGTLATTKGGTGLTSFTANGVVYASSSSALATGSALTFDGTSLTALNNASAQSIILSRTSATARNWGLGIDGDGGFRLTDATGSNVMLSIIPSGVAYLASASELLFKYNTSVEGMRLTSNGLGIGTSSPASRLHVSGTFGSQLRLQETSGTFFDITGGGRLDIRNNAGTAIVSIAQSGNPVGTQLNINSSGNVGVGVVPSAWGSGYKVLQIGNAGFMNSAQSTWFYNNSYFDGANNIYTTTGTATRYVQQSGEHQWYNAPSGTAGASVSFTQAMTLDASGNLTIGSTTATSAKLKVNPDANTGMEVLTGNTATNTRLFFRTASTSATTPVEYQATSHLWFNSGGTQIATLDSSGRLLISGTSSSSIGGQSQNLLVYSSGTNAIGAYQTASGGYCYNSYAVSNGGTYYHMYFSDAGTSHGSITSNGVLTSYATTSDYRLKNSVLPMTGALAKVALLKPCTYKWNANGSDGEGFIAHELAEVCPQAVVGEKDAVDEDGNPKYQGIDVSYLVATLTAAIQELKAEFDAYKASHH